MDCIKSQNQCINTIVFPGSVAHPTYTMDRYINSTKFKLLFIPFQGSCTSSYTTCMAPPTMIPALLYINPSLKTNKFCLNFHGNACDVGQISMCAEKEGRAFNAHYLLVEYPRFGVADGHPNEVTLNEVAKSVHSFVIREFKIEHSEIILIGRSIGTGPVCELASQLQQAGTPPGALILQSPYCSIRDATSDLLGCVSYFLLDRWQNWRKLVGPESDTSVVRCPVLFIHADGDRVISVNHSLLMHEYRTKCGLRSEMYVQRSDAVFVKGHNFFDYERDVVLPSVDFLARNLLPPPHGLSSCGMSSGSGGTGNNNGNTNGNNNNNNNNNNSNGGNTNNGMTSNPIANNSETNSSAAGTAGNNNNNSNTSLRTIILPRDIVYHFSTIPTHFIGKYTQDQEMEFLGSNNIYKSLKCTLDVWAGWCVCPCVFCTECCVACNYNWLSCVVFTVVPSCGPVFSYQQLRPPVDPSRNTLWNVLFRPSEFGKNVREEEAANSAGVRQQRYQQRQQTRSFLRNSGTTGTTNPLLAGSMLGDQNQNQNGNINNRLSGGSSDSEVGSILSSSAGSANGNSSVLHAAAILGHGDNNHISNSATNSGNTKQALDYVPG